MKFDLTSLKAGIGRFFAKEEKSIHGENHGKHLLTEATSLRVLEAYRMARTNLLYSCAGKEVGTVFGVTSASPGDGKSLTCANLAISFAMLGKRVLLVDCDMRKPTQKVAFEAEAEIGLSEYLAGVADVPLIVPTKYENLSLLTSGRCPPNPAELLYSPRLAELVAKSRAEYDFIFVDFPPVGIISDATIAVPHVDAFILVVRMMQSDYRAVQSTAESLEKVGAKIAGIMVNEVEDSSNSYYYRGRRYGRYRRYERYYRRRQGKYYERYYGKHSGRYGDSVQQPTNEDTSTSIEAPASDASAPDEGANADS